MSASTKPDGRLPGAVTRLHRAIHELIDPKTQYTNNQLLWAPSLYMQLFHATPGEHISGRRELAATAVTWMDAFQLRDEIDTGFNNVQHAYRGVPPTVGRAREILKRTWRPQDVHYISQIAAVVEEWCADIDALLNPQPRWTLDAACPACNETTVYRRDSAGENVRQPALQVGPSGCYCTNPRCQTYWEPYRLPLLAKVLGLLPDGILE